MDIDILKELIKQKLIDKKTATLLQKEAKAQGKNVEDIILQKNLVPEELLYSVKAKLLGIRLKKDFSLQDLEELTNLIPRQSMEFYKMVPLGKKRDIIEVGMVYPEDLRAQEALKFLSRQQNFKYKVFLITPSLFKEIMKNYAPLSVEVRDVLKDIQAQLEGKVQTTLLQESRVSTKRAEAPISKMVAVILKHAVEGNASDVHIEPMAERTRVRFRLDGILHSSLFLPKQIHNAVVMRIKIIANLKIDESRIPQDGRFTVSINNQDIDFRVSTFPTIFGEKVVMRVLNPANRLTTFESLGLEGALLKKVRDSLLKPYGMILVTGPTGCGKTTTLYVILEYLNKEGVNIVTLEDPVEYKIKGINQSQVKPEIGYDFANGLRHILRQDPDIIMVGEIRDTETAQLATHAALTGHVVLSTLHTNNAIGVIPRLIDLEVQSFLIPTTLNVAIAQRLVRKLCPKCRKKVKPPETIKNMIEKEIETLPLSERKNILNNLFIWKPVGCVECAYTGYSGRIGIFEVLQMTEGLARIITEKPTEERLLEEARKQGMITMRLDGILKALKGLTSIEEVIRVTEEYVT